ncbi:hypothetical protein D3C87_1700820 [compost metagenome]
MFFGIAPGHQGSGLVEDIDYRIQLITVEQRCADIDDDGDVHPHFADNVQGNIVDHSAVHQQPALEFDRSEHRRDRHARADDLR